MHEPNESAATRLWQLLTVELAGYPGRISLVLRMALSCTLVMAIIMVFRIPGAALGAYFPLLLPRDSTRSTWRAVRITAVVCILGTIEILLGATLFAGSPFAHFLWAIGSMFAIFYFMSAMTLGSAAVSLGLLIVGGMSIWDGSLSASARVSLTLYLLLSVLIGCAVTAMIEFLFAETHPPDMAVSGIVERLALVRELLQAYVDDRSPEPLLQHHLLCYARRGTGQLRETLIHSRQDEPYRRQLLTALALSNELMELSANLAELPHSPSAEDRRRMRALITTLEQAETHLRKGEASVWIELPDSFAISHTMPSLGEIERNIDLIVEVLSDDEADPASAEHHSPTSSVFVDDIFRGNRHLRFATRGTLSATLCYLAYLSVGWKGLNASVVTCFLTALTSVGLTRQRQLLRLLGVFVGGCILGFGSQMFLLPNIDTLLEFAVVFGISMLVCSWVATSGPRVSFAGLQMALAYDLININGFAINTSLIASRDALLGILLGLGAMWLIYDHLWATPSASALKALFIRNLRDLGSPTSRARIDHAFEELRSFADSMLFEPHVKNEAEEAVAEYVRAWQPHLRALSLIQVGLSRQREMHPPLSRVSERAQAATSKALAQIAAMLEGTSGASEDFDNFSGLLSELEMVQARCGAEDRALAMEVRLSHSLVVLAKDLHEQAMQSAAGAFRRELQPI